MNHIARAFLILLVGTILAVVVNTVRSSPLTWIYEVEGTLDDPEVLEEHSASLDEVRLLYEQGAPFLIDARKVEVYQKGHILGAINIPFDVPENHLEALFANCLPDQPVVVYCEGAECESSKIVCRFLEESGYSETKIYLAGYDSLVAAGLDEIPGSGPYGDEGEMGFDPNDPNDPNMSTEESGE